MCFTKSIWKVAVGVLLLGAMVAVCEAGKSKFNAVLAPGDPAPRWEDLPGLDGNVHSLADLKASKAVVVVFTSNRCPVAKAYEDRLARLARRFADRGVEVVAISVSRHPADAIERVSQRTDKGKRPFQYLFDGSQKIGRAYGVHVSLQVFVLDGQRRIAYLGAFDDNTDAEKVSRHYTADAIEAVLQGKTPEVRESLPRGCAVEYSETRE